MMNIEDKLAVALASKQALKEECAGLRVVLRHKTSEIKRLKASCANYSEKAVNRLKRIERLFSDVSLAFKAGFKAGKNPSGYAPTCQEAYEKFKAPVSEGQPAGVPAQQ